MENNQLRYLIAIAKHKHFGKAAKACHISQPALSMQLKKLEEQLGVQLVERTNKKVIITTAGEAIVRRAQEIITAIDDLKTFAHQQHQYRGVLRLGAFPTLAPFILPKIIPTISRVWPRLILQLKEEKTADILRLLLSGDMDCGLLSLPITEPSLAMIPLFKDPFYLAVSTKHPLAQHHTVSIEDVDRKKILLLEEGHCLRDQALEICHKTHNQAQHDFQGTSIETLRQMVIANNGITLIPQTAIIESEWIRYIPFADPVPFRTIALVYRKSDARTQLYNQIATMIKESQS